MKCDLELELKRKNTLPTYPPTYLPAYLPTRLPTYLPTYKVSQTQKAMLDYLLDHLELWVHHFPWNRVSQVHSWSLWHFKFGFNV